MNIILCFFRRILQWVDTLITAAAAAAAASHLPFSIRYSIPSFRSSWCCLLCFCLKVWSAPRSCSRTLNFYKTFATSYLVRILFHYRQSCRFPRRMDAVVLMLGKFRLLRNIPRKTIFLYPFAKAYIWQTTPIRISKPVPITGTEKLWFGTPHIHSRCTIG